MPTVGLLYPGHSAEDDFPALEVRFDGAVRLPVAFTSVGEDAHRVDALLDLGSDERLADGAAQLAGEKPDAVMWACTSGSFVFGPQGAQNQVSAVAAAAGVASPSGAGVASAEMCDSAGRLVSPSTSATVLPRRSRDTAASARATPARHMKAGAAKPPSTIAVR